MTGYLLAILCPAALVVAGVVGDLVSGEVRGWLDFLPHFTLWIVAVTRLDPVQQVVIYEDEWLPELSYILKGAESRPVSRLVVGMHFSLSLLTSHIDKRNGAGVQVFTIRPKDPATRTFLSSIAGEMHRDAGNASSKLRQRAMLSSKWQIYIGDLAVSPDTYRRLHKETEILILDMGQGRRVPMTLGEFDWIASELSDIMARKGTQS